MRNIEKLQKYGNKSDLQFKSIIIFLDRQETDLEGKNPITYLEQQGLKVHSILKVREVVEFLKDNVIDPATYELFQDYFNRYGT